VSSVGVTGANGHLGRLVIEDLEQKGAGVIALARAPAKAADVGVPVREADYNKPATLERAFAGVDRLVLISSSEVGKRAAQHRNVIRAAKKAGVKRIVYTSLLHADRSPLDLAAEHLATEAELKASGIPYTILRNGWYTENYTGSVGAALASGAFLGSAGDGRISSATRADFAGAIAAVAIGPGRENETYELAGDDAFTLSDLAAEISRQTGKTIAYRNLPQADYAAALTGFGLPVPVARAIAGYDVGASKGALFDEGRQLSELIGRGTTPLAVAVADALRAAP
jgi:NAD(P)H dehydrogenase (quinone)